jgi:hypothetical protein
MSSEVFCDADDNGVNGNNDEGFFSHDSQRVNAININDAKGSTGMLEEEHKMMLADSIRKLGNMSRRPIDKCTTKDIVKHGLSMIKTNLQQTGRVALQKVERKQESILQSIDYFSIQMDNRRELLKTCSL